VFRGVGFALGVHVISRLLLSVVVTALLAQAGPASAQTPNVVTRETTFTATVHRVERSSRVVTFKGDSGTLQDVYVDPSVTIFNDLQAGDIVTVRLIDSVIVQVRPDAKPSGLHDTTDEAKKAGGDKVVAQSKVVVTIEGIDAANMVVKYRTEYNQQFTRVVSDKRLLEGLRPGDRVEVTLTRERAIDIKRKQP
jgi:hypothetical protein